MPFTGAALCRRAAVLTTSPEAMPSPASGWASRRTSASPVVIPTRSSRSSSSANSRIASAARTARSGSSSCAVGAPKSAMTASPMNFSTVPPWRSSSARTRSWYGPRSASTSSGSIDSARAVKPTRSQKTTVTTLRSRRAALIPSPPLQGAARPTRRTTSHRSGGRRSAPSRAPQLPSASRPSATSWSACRRCDSASKSR